MKVRERVLFLASLLLLVSVGGIVNLIWQMPRFDQIQDPKAILQVLILLVLFGAGLVFSILELVRQEIRTPLINLTAQVARLKERQINGQRFELTGSKDIDLLASALNDFIKGFQNEGDFAHLLAESFPDTIFLFDREGCVLFGNVNAARQWNYRGDEIIGKHQKELFPPKIAERHKQIIKQVLETGQPVSFDVHEMIGERQCWIDTRMIPVLDANGRVTAILNISRDITERKRKEEEIKWLARLPSENPNPVLRIARDGKLLYVNPAGVKQLPEWRLQVGWPVLPWLRDVAAQALAEEATRAIVIEYGERMYSLFVAPIVDGAYANLYGHDITERKKMEAELRQKRQELFHMERVQIIGKLAASLAHELKQPLAGILMNAQAAQRFLAGTEPDLSQIREILADIVADDQRAGEVIHRLRPLLRKEEPINKPMDINSAVRNMAALVHDEAIARSVSLHLELAEGLPQVDADMVQIEQVILNLIMNAVQAMEDIAAHGRNIAVATARSAPDGVMVSVRDTGPGIAKDKLEQVFEPFYTTRAQGLGLGLPICRSIVEAHGGRIWAENNPDGGARLYFSLPAGGGK